MMRTGGPSPVMPITPTAKKIIYINVGIWLFAILAGYVASFMGWTSDSNGVMAIMYEWFGFLPRKVIESFWIWQPFTYMFMHSPNFFHLLFNMLLVWWLGAELEVYWGRRYFLFYYIACGVGASIIYLIGVTLYYLVTKNYTVLAMPVVGASGAVFGLILAYGFLFGERVIYFMMLFPMKAKVFVMIIGGVELMNLMSEGMRSQVANLAHLGGLITGFILIKLGPKIRDLLNRRRTKAYGRKLKLVVDNDGNKVKGPKYWN
jgi:membrane associated rhomboid family serine protease